jgi:hypothetical protein
VGGGGAEVVGGGAEVVGGALGVRLGERVGCGAWVVTGAGGGT